MSNAKKRCEWPKDDKVYIAYHDKEWGVPVYDDRKLFEMLLLEGAQAGLSWITILKRREGYRKVYDNFIPEKIANWSDEKIEGLLQNPRIIRNRLKVNSARENAKAYLNVIEEFGTFSKFLWSFVNYKPIVNRFKNLSQIPATTNISDEMSVALKKRGFNFVGSTICYAYMQSIGMVNDHITSCFRYNEIQKNFNNKI